MNAKYIIDLDKLEATAKVAKANADRLGVHLLMALKSFPLPDAFPTLAPYLEGITCSGLFESKLAARSGLAIHVHAPAYQADEMNEICATCSHVVFNSLDQLRRFGPIAKANGVSVGLRLNPGFSAADSLKYDPCCPDSRFGVLPEELTAADETLLGLLDGLHLHALCEGYADDFAALVERVTILVRDLFAARPVLKRIADGGWINLGGGEVINDPAFASPRAIAAVQGLQSLGGFALMIEPSEYMVRYAGSIEAHVLDVMHREKDIAVLDISASCHATDLVLFDMKPDVLSPAQAAEGKTTILGCVSCLAGDVLGEYVFERPLAVGDTVVLGGLGCYSFAQQSWFNGIRHPEVVLTSKAHGVRTILSWTYEDYQREFVR